MSSVKSVANARPDIKTNRDVSIAKKLGNNVVLISPKAVSLTKHSEEERRITTMPNTSLNRENPGNEQEKAADLKLVKRVQKGDKAAFDLLMVKYQGKVGSIVSRYIGDFHEIADVTQETFIKVYRAVGKFRGDSAFSTWLYRIATNCAKNYLIAKGRRPPATDIEISDAELVSPSPNLKDITTPEAQLSKEQIAAAVDEAIRALPEDLRGAFTLREFDGLSYEEIAAVMDCPVGTVRSRIFRAREFVDKAIRSASGELV